MIRFLRLFIACYLLFTTYYLLFFSLLYSYPPGWSDDILLTPEDMKERMYPDIDVDAFNNVWVVWDSATWVNGTAEVLYSKRDSLGGCLIPETSVSNNATYSVSPRIAVDGSNNIQFVWLDETPQGLGLWHAKFANDGSVLVPPHMAVSGNNDLIPFRNIAINKYKEINVCWSEVSSGNNRIIYTKLDSLGNPIIYKIQVSPPGIYSCWEGIGVDSLANSHLGYRTNFTSVESLAYTKVDKDGNILISNKILDTGLLPTLIADRSQNIHIVYAHHTPTNWVINYLKIDQQGNIIIWPKRLSSIQHYSMSPSMALDSLQYLHVVWEFDNWVDTLGIMYTKLDTMGNFVIPPMKVVYPPYSPGGGMARITVDRYNHLHLVWVDGRIDPPNSADIFYKLGENVQTVKELQRLKAQNQLKISAVPNPFVNETKIHFSLSPESEKCKIEIFDILGRRIKQFNHLLCSKGENDVTWDGTDENGKFLSNGIFFVVYENGKDRLTQKVILIR